MIKERGYEAINIIDIAYNAKVSVGTIYYHFPKGKNSILTEILSRLTAKYIQRFKEKMAKENILQSSESFDAALKWMFKMIVELRREDKHFLAFIQAEALRDPERYEELLSEYEAGDVVSSGMGVFGQLIKVFNTRFPDESIQFKGNEKQLLRVLGTMLTHQIIFEGYYGSDEEFVEVLTRICRAIL